MNDKRFEGVWRIEEMEVWGDHSLNLLGPANITFDDDGLGSSQFIAVVGFIDSRFSERDGRPLVEFSWQGHDDNDDACVRGWAMIAARGSTPHCACLPLLTLIRAGHFIWAKLRRHPLKQLAKLKGQ